MRKYRLAIIKDEKQVAYENLIRVKRNDGTLDKIKRAEQLRGKITTNPTNPMKVVELASYKTLEPILFLEPHKHLQKRVDKIANMKARIKDEGRPPTDIELAAISKYNE